MSDLTGTMGGSGFRGNLLATVSAVVVVSYLTSAGAATAEDAGHPQVWVELGGQFEQMKVASERFAPGFVTQINTNILPSPVDAQRSPRSTIGANGKLTFTPGNSDWVFSAMVRFGRSSSKQAMHVETSPGSAEEIVSVPAFTLYNKHEVAAPARRFVHATGREEEHHDVIDFQAGKDVGLGLLGASSVISAGVRYAQFNSSSNVLLGANPDFHFAYSYVHGIGPFPSAYRKRAIPEWHVYAANSSISRSFHGIGPSLSWDASASVVGNRDAANLTIDWGINAALLFGRQKVRGHHDTDATFETAPYYHATTPYPHRSHNPIRSKSVSVPNVGAFAGLSFRYPNAKVSVGYRADLFFGAMDGGIDTRITYDRDFYGPFATISVGLGG